MPKLIETTHDDKSHVIKVDVRQFLPHVIHWKSYEANKRKPILDLSREGLLDHPYGLLSHLGHHDLSSELRRKPDSIQHNSGSVKFTVRGSKKAHRVYQDLLDHHEKNSTNFNGDKVRKPYMLKSQ